MQGVCDPHGILNRYVEAALEAEDKRQAEAEAEMARQNQLTLEAMETFVAEHRLRELLEALDVGEVVHTHHNAIERALAYVIDGFRYRGRLRFVRGDDRRGSMESKAVKPVMQLSFGKWDVQMPADVDTIGRWLIGVDKEAWRELEMEVKERMRMIAFAQSGEIDEILRQASESFPGHVTVFMCAYEKRKAQIIANEAERTQQDAEEARQAAERKAEREAVEQQWQEWRRRQAAAWQEFRLYEVEYASSGDGDAERIGTLMSSQPEPDADGWWLAVGVNGSQSRVKILHPTTVTERWIKAPDMSERKPRWRMDYCFQATNGLWMPAGNALMRYTSEAEVHGG